MLGYRTMEWDGGRATQGSEVEWGGEGEGKDKEEGINGRAEGWLCEGGEGRVHMHSGHRAREDYDE